MNEYKAYKNLVKHKEKSIRCSQKFVVKTPSALAAQASRRKLQLLPWPAAQPHLSRP
jgi:hypothetical protein